MFSIYCIHDVFFSKERPLTHNIGERKWAGHKCFNYWIYLAFRNYAKLTPHYKICYASDQLAYIVVPGLDPALPDFNGVATDSRLDPSDAEFVDCIHTCGGLYGFYDPLCDLDFYPNRGQPVQPGCWFFHLVGVYSLIA